MIGRAAAAVALVTACSSERAPREAAPEGAPAAAPRQYDARGTIRVCFEQTGGLYDDLARHVHDAGYLRELGHCRAEFDALWSLTKRNVSQSSRGVTGAGAIVIKLAYSEARQRFGELCLRVLDRDALHVDDNELVEERLRTLALPIAAGASQIQRNIISERLLGMPREPR